MFAGLMWMASVHPAAKKTPLHGTSISGMVKEKAGQAGITEKSTGITH